MTTPKDTEKVQEDRRKVGVFERHLHTGTLMVVVALLVWIGSTTQKNALSIVELKSDLNGFIKREDLLYRSLERRMAQAEDRLTNIAARTRDCEQRIILHEKTLPD